MSWYYEGFKERLKTKLIATEEELAMYVTTEEGKVGIQFEDSLIPLDLEGEEDNLDLFETQRSVEDNPFWDIINNTPDCGTTPDSVDHRPNQTSIKNQLDRGTCVCFASLACLEALLIGDEKDFDLSEQYANWMYMRNQGRDQCDDGLRTTKSAVYLSQSGVCLERYAPYENKNTVQNHCNIPPSIDAQNNANYGIGSYAIIHRLGPLDPSISNPYYLECVLKNGYDIVFGTHVAWGYPDRNGVLDIKLDSNGQPIESRGGHAMLLVGYNKIAPVPYFIFKNSWGQNKSNAGYYYLSYDYIIEYAKYGYIIYDTRDDMNQNFLT
ncbi:C1 family peptidase [Fulvivirgaceae bacterium BMA12]|uniref:C1 family peptidase n=1 Tax=Agaribacillus aureus TaxID=3051825 RepID=A0ABT8L8D8_9BACT|nr:C1 family peptidase [Fulvivirgaceae bacterium BMA12]